MYKADTIVAPATPPGRGGVAIIRVSGPDALAIVAKIWQPTGKMDGKADRRLKLGRIRDPLSGSTLDRAMCAIFPAPHTLTGEPVAEIHCHGSPYLVRRIVGIAADLGARIAEPGEFTRRAYLNGRIDLTAAEAIADLVDARSEVALTQAAGQLAGALAKRINSLRERIITIRAHLEAEIDFSDEDISLPSREGLATDIAELADDIRLLRDGFARGRIAREGARAAIIGKPNAGKSSVLNLLLGIERAIVTPIPGTTRDTIEDSITVGNWPLVLIDTAGIRDSVDQIEQIGISRALDAAASADILLAVFDSSRPFEKDDADIVVATEGHKGVALLNKRDLSPVLDDAELRRRGLELPIVHFSAVTAGGLEQLREALRTQLESLAETGSADGVVITRERHRAALAQAHDALTSGRKALQAGMPPEIVAVDIAAASDALASITGAISADDLLDDIFREFCIGK